MPTISSNGAKFACCWFAAMMFAFMSGCSFGKGGVPSNGDVVHLTLTGYNYTKNSIADYWVNGTWGGGIQVSTPTAGGSKMTCCVRWRMGQDLPVKVHVKWMSGACSYVKHPGGGSWSYTDYKQFYSERDVWLKGSIPKDPKYFETHFYPDGHIDVAVSDDFSPPRLVLYGETGGVRKPKKWPKCTPEQLKQKD